MQVASGIVSLALSIVLVHHLLIDLITTCLVFLSALCLHVNMRCDVVSGPLCIFGPLTKSDQTIRNIAHAEIEKQCHERKTKGEGY